MAGGGLLGFILRHPWTRQVIARGTAVVISNRTMDEAAAYLKDLAAHGYKSTRFVALPDSDEVMAASGCLPWSDYERELWLLPTDGLEKFRLILRVTITDTPPHEYAVGAAIAIADAVVLPCTPSGLGLSAIEQAIGAIGYARDKRGVDVPALLLPKPGLTEILRSLPCLVRLFPDANRVPIKYPRPRGIILKRKLLVSASFPTVPSRA